MESKVEGQKLFRRGHAFQTRVLSGVRTDTYFLVVLRLILILILRIHSESRTKINVLL